MAATFSRTVQSLSTDRGRGVLWGISVAAVVLGAWACWFLLARIGVYVASDFARLEIEQAAHPVEAPVARPDASCDNSSFVSAKTSRPTTGSFHRHIGPCVKLHPAPKMSPVCSSAAPSWSARIGRTAPRVPVLHPTKTGTCGNPPGSHPSLPPR